MLTSDLQCDKFTLTAPVEGPLSLSLYSLCSLSLSLSLSLLTSDSQRVSTQREGTIVPRLCLPGLEVGESAQFIVRSSLVTPPQPPT